MVHLPSVYVAWHLPPGKAAYESQTSCFHHVSWCVHGRREPGRRVDDDFLTALFFMLSLPSRKTILQCLGYIMILFGTAYFMTSKMTMEIVSTMRRVMINNLGG